MNKNTSQSDQQKVASSADTGGAKLRRHDEIERFRVEGIARGGRILHVNVVGSPGLWKFFGSAGFRLEIRANTVEDALRVAGRRLPFRPVAVRKI